MLCWLAFLVQLLLMSAVWGLWWANCFGEGVLSCISGFIGVSIGVKYATAVISKGRIIPCGNLLVLLLAGRGFEGVIHVGGICGVMSLLSHS